MFTPKERELLDLLHLEEVYRLALDLKETIKSREQLQLPTRVVLVTYNRVGRGFASRTVRGRTVLEVFDMDHQPSDIEVAGLFDRVMDDFARKVPFLDAKTVYVIYGGGRERFEQAMNLASDLFETALNVGKSVECHLLTCRCEWKEKVSLSSSLCETGRVHSVAFNPSGECGGFADMQAIAEAVLKGAQGEADFMRVPIRGFIS